MCFNDSSVPVFVLGGRMEITLQPQEDIQVQVMQTAGDETNYAVTTNIYILTNLIEFIRSLNEPDIMAFSLWIEENKPA